jgi:hypothetical protein
LLATQYATVTDKDVKAATSLLAELAGADVIFADVERLRIEAAGSWPHQQVRNQDGTVSNQRLPIP